MKIQINNTVRDMTSEEEEAHNTLITKTRYTLVDGNKEMEFGKEADYLAAKEIVDQKIAKQTSGKTKLKNLGLDDAEIKALTGA